MTQRDGSTVNLELFTCRFQDTAELWCVGGWLESFTRRSRLSPYLLTPQLAGSVFTANWSRTLMHEKIHVVRCVSYPFLVHVSEFPTDMSSQIAIF